MALKVKELVEKPELLAPGHRACAGCAGPIVLRQVLRAADSRLVVGFSTGCMEVSTTIYPFTAWRVPFIHSAFENVAATMSGVETAHRALKRRGKVSGDVNFIAFGGDGGIYDIGFQSLSGAMERGHKMLVVCYDNEGYMNTGIQRSSATPKGAETNTSPAGKVKAGKEQHRKDLVACMIAHDVPYVAQSASHNFRDLMAKVQKALATDGPSFINVLAPCHRGWRYPMEQTVGMSELAAETCFWPLYEVERGVWKVSYKPKEKKPLTEWLKPQGRFRHLFTEENKHIIDELQAELDRKWEYLLKMEEMSKK